MVNSDIMAKKSTSVNIEEEKWNEFKGKVATRGESVSKALEGLLRMALEDPRLVDEAIQVMEES